ncbi:MAG: hypothetical protein WBV60_05615, partial [Terriglobales bacterium]
GAWRYGKRSAFPTSPHPRRRLRTKVKRGVTLTFHLVQKIGQVTLIIDQPEDNLDSLSVYASLIEYFRKRKKTRQIIIITHNPNLVVNTDAEQIVIADFDGIRNPHIQYKSGALEDIAGSEQEPSIREGVCRVLEGGREAFLRREQKYAIGAP